MGKDFHSGFHLEPATRVGSFSEPSQELAGTRTKQKNLIETGYPAKTGKLFSFYTRIMTKVTDSERCSVFIHDPERDKVWLKAGTGVPEQGIEVPKEGSVVGKVIATGEPVVVSGLEAKQGAHKVADKKTGFITRSILCVPIKSPIRNEITGAFQLLNKMDGREFTDEDIALALEVAEHLQREVEGVFLDQEIFGLRKRLYSATKKAMTFLIVSVVLGFMLLFLALVGSGFLVRILG